MRKLIVASICLFVLAAPVCAEKLGDGPETDMVIHLRGLTAVCEISNLKIRLKLPDDPNTGEIESGLKQANSCVEDALPKGKEFYKKAIALAPASRDQLAIVYSRWLGYLQSLTNYQFVEQNEAEADFDSAVNDLQATLDARP